MAKEDIITGLDIGSTTIRVAVAQTGADGEVNIIGASEHPAEGISKGVITSIEDAVSSISGALEKAERMTGIPIEHATVSVSGAHVISQESHGVVAVAKADGEIKDDDVERVIEAAQTVATPPNHEILHVIPRQFTVDGQTGIKDPLGMTGVKLEVDAQIILGQVSQIKNLTKCIYRTGVDIDDLVLGILAASESVLTKRQKELGVGLVNLGGLTTSLMVFEEGEVIHTKIMPIGAGHITNDIAIGLRTSVDVAEKVKTEYGTAIPDDISKREEFDLSNIEPNEDGIVSKREVAEIIEARMEEIFSMIKKELKQVEKDGMLPAGLVFTGGGSRLPELIDLAKREFNLPASVGVPKDFTTAIEKVNDPVFAVAIGLCIWGANISGKGGSTFGRFSSVGEVTGKMKGWFKSLMP
ncbi:cell division protein FtsA [Patescibacteria group bacterium]|nr:cell division protein FtsA [Patescibacteria group bacterium]MBU1673361.1 cell division protein FtsA [Patescibacteria group bacterium]MBU1963419.1 cell division protein FtsA [Patescibacteria group bacterium]